MGKCPSMTYQTETSECKRQQPGGLCAGTPTGTGNCTWSYTDNAEHITLNELYEFAGNKTQAEFWSDPNDEGANTAKVNSASALFSQKYGNELTDPVCDFDYGKFYS